MPENLIYKSKSGARVPTVLQKNRTLNMGLLLSCLGVIELWMEVAVSWCSVEHT